MPEVGLEPTRYHYQRVLSASRLPISPLRHIKLNMRQRSFTFTIRQNSTALSSLRVRLLISVSRDSLHRSPAILRPSKNCSMGLRLTYLSFAYFLKTSAEPAGFNSQSALVLCFRHLTLHLSDSNRFFPLLGRIKP